MGTDKEHPLVSYGTVSSVKKTTVIGEPRWRSRRYCGRRPHGSTADTLAWNRTSGNARAGKVWGRRQEGSRGTSHLVYWLATTLLTTTWQYHRRHSNHYERLACRQRLGSFGRWPRLARSKPIRWSQCPWTEVKVTLAFSRTFLKSLNLDSWYAGICRCCE